MNTDEQVIEHYGVRLVLDRKIVSRTVASALLEGRYEHKEANLLLEILEPGERILEIGAGIGFVSVVAAKTGRVEAQRLYEANPALLDYISSTHRLNGVDNIDVRNEILSSEQEDGETSFYLRHDFWASSTNPEPWKYKEVIKVKVSSLEQAVLEFKPSLIICDIEGGELELFRKARLPGVKKALVEVHEPAIGPRGVRQLNRAFKAMGFKKDKSRSTKEMALFHSKAG